MVNLVTGEVSPETTEVDAVGATRPVLVIVESPTKAKTLSKILGAGYQVEATKGHIRELVKVSRTGNSFTPQYSTMAKKYALIAHLSSLVQSSSRVVLATDDDREGESIADDLVTLLGLSSLGPATPVERVVFHEITPTAVTAAFAAPRSLDQNLVESQRARQILDKEIGVHLSRAIANQVANYRFNMKYASGRVQAPALLLVVDRELARRRFIAAPYDVLDVNLACGDVAQLRELNGQRLATDGSDFGAAGQVVAGCSVLQSSLAQKLATALPGMALTVHSTKVTQRKESPKPPFTTATLQQAASTYLGFPPEETMVHAQKLYELGLISYMRTDSAALSTAALAACDLEIARIGQKPTRRSVGSVSHAQNAHEAIRPAIDESGVFVSPQDARSAVSAARTQALFELIWRRTVASQMEDCVRDLTATKLEGAVSTDSLMFVVNSSLVTSLGFREIWSLGDQPTESGSSFLVGQRENVVSAQAHSFTTSPPKRFSEAGLIKEMVKLGIGRPSTYAPTLKKLLDHNFARRGNGRVLVPTARGVLVATALRGLPVSQAGNSVANSQFTATMETGLDQVAAGTQTQEGFLNQTFGPSSGPGLLSDLVNWSTTAPGFRYQLLGSFPCPKSSSPAGYHNLGEVHLRAGTGKRFDYGECRGCESKCVLPESYAFGDTSDTDVAHWIHTRSNRHLGDHDGAEVWACFGDTGGYIEVRGPGDRRETCPLESDPSLVTFEEAVVIIKSPRVPRLLGHSAATGFPVWLRSGRNGLVLEAGPDASRPLSRNTRRNMQRRTASVPLPEGLTEAVVLEDVSELVDDLLSEEFPGERFEPAEAPNAEGHPAAPTPPPPDRASLIEAISEFLRVSPNSPARVIAKAIGSDKRSVNSCLHNSRDIFTKNDGTPPLWRLV